MLKNPWVAPGQHPGIPVAVPSTVDVDIVLCDEFDHATVVAFCNEVMKGVVVYLAWMGLYEFFFFLFRERWEGRR